MYFRTVPREISLQVFSAMPAHLRKTGVRSEWADANKGGACIDSFLEGPVFDPAGNLYVTDIPYGRILRISPAGEWSLVAEYKGEPNGMKFLNARELVVADYRNGLLRVNVDTGEVTTLLGRRNAEQFKGVNDLVISRNGDLYFTDQGQTGLHDPTGRVYRLRPGGQLDLLLGNVPSPNGLALSCDEKVLFVAATRGNCVWRVPLQADGSVSKVGQFFTFYGTSGPDGMAIDSRDRLFVAHASLGCVWVLSKRGEPEAILASPAGATTTNLAFQPAVEPGQPRKVFVTESETGTILFADLDEAGLGV
ncbi:SMP-30/gluconolactonase/LRE family protein [Cupriavidus basilensis]|uniref:SMP-30/gluconolactonase/LRE family protein n=1 Tax=Cupriavidus basilensis TaxID=68895 RepID=UPI0039F729D9